MRVRSLNVLLLVEVCAELIYSRFVTRSNLRSILLAQEVSVSDWKARPGDIVLLSHVTRYIPRIGGMWGGWASCLHQSICAWRILRRRSIPAHLVIAPCQQMEDEAIAHAWVELPDGSVVGQRLPHAVPFECGDCS